MYGNPETKKNGAIPAPDAPPHRAQRRPVSRGRRWLRFILMGAGLLAFGLLLATVWAGAPPRPAVALGKPKGLLLLLAVCVLGTHLLSGPRTLDRRRFLALISRWAVLGISLAVSLSIAEYILRHTLLQHNLRGNLQDLIDTDDEGVFRFEGGFTPLLAIIRRSDNPRLIYELEPGLDMVFGHRRLRTNAAGQRDDRTYTQDKPDGVFRIVGIGDSFMFGWGVEQGEDFLRRLDDALNQRESTTFEVINLAVPGYNTQQEVDMLRDRGLAYHPDLVLLGWCDNDFDLPFLIEKPWSADKGRSLLYSLLFYRTQTLAPRITRAHELEASDIDPAVLEYSGEAGVTRALTELQQLQRDHGFKLWVIGAMNPRIVDICRRLGLPYLNTRERISAGDHPEEYALHFMHPRAGGHRVIAEVMARELESMGWLP